MEGQPNKDGVEPVAEKAQTPESSPDSPRIDIQFAQGMGNMWGDIRKNFTAQNPEQGQALDRFFTDMQDRFGQLKSERRAAQVHQFDELEEFADGLPMLMDFLGRAYKNERTGYSVYAEGMQEEIQNRDQRNKRLFSDTSRKLFPEIVPPKSLAEASTQLETFLSSTDDFAEALIVKSALELFKDPSISMKRKAEIVDDLIAQIGDVQETNANYGQTDMNDKPFGAVNKQQAIDAARLVYHLSLVREQFQKELYGRENASSAEAKAIDAVRRGIDGSGDQTVTGGGMTDEEVVQARERVRKTKIS